MTDAQPSSPSTSYVARLGLFDGVIMTVGGIIGAGIFLNLAIVAQRVDIRASSAHAASRRPTVSTGCGPAGS